MSRKAAVEPKWNFYLDTNKSTGIQYVQTSYNIWVPEKKQPRLGGKAYVGRLFPDGSVRPSKTFLERFPQYADKKLYYFENQLVDREGYLKLNPNAEAQWEELQSQEKRECQDFCVWGGYSRGSPTRLPFVFEMQYARPDAIAGAKVEGARAERGRILLSPRYRAPRSGWRVSARGLIISLPYSMAPVKRSPNSRANWGMAAAHLGVARFQEAVKFMMAR